MRFGTVVSPRCTRSIRKWNCGRQNPGPQCRMFSPLLYRLRKGPRPCETVAAQDRAGPASGRASVSRLYGNSGDWADKLALAPKGLRRRMTAAAKEDSPKIVAAQLGNTHHGHIIRGLRRRLERPAAEVALSPNLPRYRAACQDRDGFARGRPGRGWRRRRQPRRGLTVACAALEPRIKRASPAFPFLLITDASGRWTTPRTPTPN